MGELIPTDAKELETWIRLRLHLAREGAERAAAQSLHQKAREERDRVYGPQVFLRGLIEFSSYCRQDCFYCGLRRSNLKAERYRIKPEQILECCRSGALLGFQTFVLQSGEDTHYDDLTLCQLVDAIKQACPGCAVTLSLGERSRQSYRALFAAGADRYLLRHETANLAHFSRLHPAPQTFESRKQCLYTLKEIGFQTGAGFMVGAPGQTPKTLAQDLLFLRELRPHMVGIGPFIPHQETPFAECSAGSLEETLLMLSAIRLMLPEVLLPSTTALASLHPEGRKRGLLAGANVVMPNLSPQEVRGQYAIYDGKQSSGAESAEGLSRLQREIEQVGMKMEMGRGDAAGFVKG